MQRRTLWLAWLFVPFVLVSILHVWALAVDSDVAGPTKLLLMPLLAAPVMPLFRRRPVLSPVLLLVALLFSWLGDGAGALFPNAPELPLMLGFFGLAHVVYIALFLRVLHRRTMPWWTLVYVAWWIAAVTVLGPHTGSLLPAVAAYGIILGGTAAAAARCHPVITCGGVLFLMSDTILAFRLFLPEAMPDWTSPAVMLTYTAGQGLIIAGAVMTLRAQPLTRGANRTGR